MKNLLNKILLLTILPTMALTGCNKNEPLVPPEPVIHWTEEIDDYLKESIGEYYVEIPIFTEGDFYEGSVETEDDITYTTLYLDTQLSTSTANLVYKTVLLNNDFVIDTLDSGLYQATKSVSLEHVLVVTYASYKDKKRNTNVFAIETFLYRDKMVSWPTDDVTDFFGCDIPHYEAPYYQFQKGYDSSGTELIAVVAYGVVSDCETKYMQTLKSAGYVVRTGLSTCNAISHEDKINLEFYYDEDYQALVIYGGKLTDDLTWPTEWIKQILGADAIPVYSDPAVTYNHGQAILENGSYYNIVECDYAPKSSLSVYTEQLIGAGWTKEPEDADLPDDWPLFLATEGHMERFHKGTHEIEVRYYDPEDLLTGQYYDLYYPILMIIIYK